MNKQTVVNALKVVGLVWTSVAIPLILAVIAVSLLMPLNSQIIDAIGVSVIMGFSAGAIFISRAGLKVKKREKTNIQRSI